MRIVFAGDLIIKITSEVIEVSADDQGEAWKPKYSKTQGDIMLKYFNANKKFISKTTKSSK